MSKDFSPFQFIDLPSIPDKRGCLTYIYQKEHIPIRIESAMWIVYTHNNRNEEFLYTGNQSYVCISLQGTVVVEKENKLQEKKFLLMNPNKALLIPKETNIKMSANRAVMLLLKEQLKKKVINGAHLSGRDTMVGQCKLIKIQRIEKSKNEKFNLVSTQSIPFEIKRLYYIFNVPEDAERGSHAHKELHQCFIAVNGSIEVELYDGINHKTFVLDNNAVGLLVVPGLWRYIRKFSKNAICLVFASNHFSEKDYIRNLNEFLKFKKISSSENI